jgi:hypothetical protein
LTRILQPLGCGHSFFSLNIIILKLKKKKEGSFYFFAFLVYAYVPNATMTNAKTVMIAAADENSFIFGVGVGVGSVTVLLVGINNACRAVVWETAYESGLVVDVVGPFPVTISQHSNLKPVPAVAVKV